MIFDDFRGILSWMPWKKQAKKWDKNENEKNSEIDYFLHLLSKTSNARYFYPKINIKYDIFSLLVNFYVFLFTILLF